MEHSDTNSILTTFDAKHGKVVITYGTTMKHLGPQIIESLGFEENFIALRTKKFMDTEICLDFESSVRGSDLFIIQSICGPEVNDAFMETLLAIDAARRASAHRITLVMPYYGYARQDRVAYPRQPLSAKVIADCLQTVGIDRIIVCDIHVPQIQGFFSSRTSFDHVRGKHIFISRLAELHKDLKFIVSSTDAGGACRCRELAQLLSTNLVILDKRRYADNQAEVMNVIGDVTGANVILYDDICDTAGSLVHAGDALLKAGANKIFAAITHPVLSGPAVERLMNSKFEKLFFSDSIPISEEKAQKLGKRLEIISCKDAVANVIKCIHEDISIGDYWNQVEQSFQVK
ncbi:Ribose-phosphate pyrophosphokinase [Spironucleus salmonicida]|uniref:ribose-phosphate diphosphokinase n=1 Tax=Spironucleus salmonicida TaxID=348837 RepID=V6LFY1_9EUKA|nr:Ribose-phosphate pyrophosphokinase [Spironucleus salmonicida]|eukprot:EST43465.1 Ribose-phosphate pyrophosphokinase [Spironucleus salmonicida]